MFLQFFSKLFFSSTFDCKSASFRLFLAGLFVLLVSRFLLPATNSKVFIVVICNWELSFFAFWSCLLRSALIWTDTSWSPRNPGTSHEETYQYYGESSAKARLWENFWKDLINFWIEFPGEKILTRNYSGRTRRLNFRQLLVFSGVFWVYSRWDIKRLK